MLLIVSPFMDVVCDTLKVLKLLSAPSNTTLPTTASECIPASTAPAKVTVVPVSVVLVPKTTGSE